MPGYGRAFPCQGGESVGVHVEITTEDFTLTLSTDIVGYNPDVVDDMIRRLPQALAHITAHLTVPDDDDDG